MKETDKRKLTGYFTEELMDLLPLNYQYAKVFDYMNEISEEEKEWMSRYFSNEQYQTDHASIKGFYKMI